MRARLGVILPSVNTVVEPWFNRVLPSDVALHATRMLLADALTPDALRKMDEDDGLGAVTRIASCRPEAIAYGCTASSVIQGMTYDDHLIAVMEAASGRPCLTAVSAILAAVGLFEARTLAIASPYDDAIDAAERRFFENAGFRVVKTANLGIKDAYELASPTTKELLELGIRASDAQADALVMSCLNCNSHAVAAQLEERLGCPVVTSTTATLWGLMRCAGLQDKISGCGVLLSEH